MRAMTETTQAAAQKVAELTDDDLAILQAELREQIAESCDFSKALGVDALLQIVNAEHKRREQGDVQATVDEVIEGIKSYGWAEREGQLPEGVVEEDDRYIAAVRAAFEGAARTDLLDRALDVACKRGCELATTVHGSSWAPEQMRDWAIAKAARQAKENERGE